MAGRGSGLFLFEARLWLVPSAMKRKILVYEYLCSGVLAGKPAVASLVSEGLAMFRAVVEDLAGCPGVQMLAPLDSLLLARDWPPALTAVAVAGEAAEQEVLSRLARQVDAALVIAPEFDGLLEQRCRWLEEWGVPLLGCGSQAVRITGDKWTLAQLWQQMGVPTPECQLLLAATRSRERSERRSGARPPSQRAPLRFGSLRSPKLRVAANGVLKPRFGAGSQATYLVHTPADLSAALSQARAEGWSSEMLLQPFVPGQPASVALLLGPGGRWPLPACRQVLSSDGRFHYLGGELPLPAALNERAQQLALRAIEVVPELRGYVGVDLVLGQAGDGSADRVIEINPRLTTSYAGLRRLARFNLAQALLALLGWDQPLPEPAWNEGPVCFQANGDIREG